MAFPFRFAFGDPAYGTLCPFQGFDVKRSTPLVVGSFGF
jgi:hypothetical protein